MVKGKRKQAAYVLGLCDEILGQRGMREHRFDFLRRDPGKDGRTAPLQVDAWYPDLRLVVEYHGTQHDEPVAFYDRRMTNSGVHRGIQRAMYDQRRRDILP